MMDRHTGKRLTGLAHIKQSIATILTTPLGSQPWLREFGSRLYQLIDQPMNLATMALIRAAVAGDIMRWEPRVRLERIEFTPAGPNGQAAVSIHAVRLDVPAPSPFTFAVTL